LIELTLENNSVRILQE